MTKENTENLFYCVSRQLMNLFNLTGNEKEILSAHFPEAADRTLKCFSHINNKYFQNGEINPLHSVQYSQFLYYYANTIFHNYSDYSSNSYLIGTAAEELHSGSCRERISPNPPMCKNAETARNLCCKLYMLNKALSACEIYYEVELPDIFLLEHPVGSVMGRAKYSNYFFFLQNCTVGANNNLYPEFGERVIMCAGSKVLGTSHIGNNVIISADTCIVDQDVPDDCIVFGRSPNLIIKTGHKEKVDAMIEENFIIS